MKPSEILWNRKSYSNITGKTCSREKLNGIGKKVMVHKEIPKIAEIKGLWKEEKELENNKNVSCMNLNNYIPDKSAFYIKLILLK